MSLEWLLLGLRLVTTVILYTFLGVAFYIIWCDLKHATNRKGSAHPISRLRVLAVPEDAALVSDETLPLQAVTLIGRDPENTIVLNDAFASVRHARLSRENGLWWLEDLGSQNGTWLNELPISKPTPLSDGDIIGIGSLRFKLEIIK